MRMLNVNILNVEKTLKLCSDAGVKNYFVVSTDKAANPVNLMGASKRVMEMFLMNYSEHLSITAARFANVAFSDGSLLYGFEQRLSKRQPLSAPRDVKRYFVTATEAGQICLFSALLGKNRDIFYPKLSANLHQTTFSEIAKRYLKQRGFKPIVCSSESEARDQIIELEKNKEWPCYFFDSDTTGEKDFEEFTTIDEVVDVDKFLDLGIIKQSPSVDWGKTQNFVKSLSELRSRGDWTTSDIIQLMTTVVQNFNHKDAGKFLDEKM
jgi:FlaA1/EpsC-like NDP-sugar epimerase